MPPVYNGNVGAFERQEIRAPSPVQRLVGKSIIQISAGGEHVLFLTESGDVFSWGCIVPGEPHTVDNSFPKLVSTLALEKALTGHRIQLISCGANHSMIVNEVGEVFSFGDGGDGRYGGARDV